MRLTKLAHAGVRLVKDGATLVIDPGGFGSGTEALAEADAVLIMPSVPIILMRKHSGMR